VDDVLSSLSAIAESVTDDYEIIIVNDASTDNSKAKVLEWAKRNNRINLVDHEVNLGYGQTLRTGFNNARKELLFYTDADMPVCLDELKKFLPLMDEYPLVIGYRLNRQDTPRRFIYSKVYNLLLRVLLKVKVKDANFSFKCMRKEIFKTCKLTAKSVFIDGELLAEASQNNLKIKEVPLQYMPRKRGKSNFDNIQAAVSTAREVLTYWVSHHLFNKSTKKLNNR